VINYRRLDFFVTDVHMSKKRGKEYQFSGECILRQMSTFCPGLDQEILTRTQQTPGDIFINIWSWATVNLVISRFFPINASGVCDVSDHTAPQHINSWSSIPMYWSIVSSMSLTNRYLWFVTSVCMNTHTYIYIYMYTCPAVRRHS
jgi:hypothetical protein